MRTQVDRTEVAIIGAGPAGLLLGHLLDRAGIDNLVLEARSRAHVEGRIRAGVLEQQSVDLLRELGLAARLDREGLRHEGIELAFGGARHRIDLARLAGGRCVTVYGQHEVVKDLIATRLARGSPLLFEAEAASLHGIDGAAPEVRFRRGGRETVLRCAAVAGCDGFHGVSRSAIPQGRLTVYEKAYPFAWLGILAAAPPASDELVYCRHDDGFALFSMRSPEITRLYLQCRPDEDAADWSDRAIWDELARRFRAAGSWAPAEGAILHRSVTGMRSFVAEPMRFGRLFLAGDAAHIVPPTGAKGMNLAIADVRVLADGLRRWLREGDERGLDGYSARGLDRIWKVQRFSWWMTSLMHRFDDESPFDRRRQRAELDYLVRSEAAAAALAENYVGLPFD